MKILFVVPRMPSHLYTGDRLRVYHLIKGLVQKGHTIDLIAFEAKEKPRIETDIYTICNNVCSIPFDDIEFLNRPWHRQVNDLVKSWLHGLPRKVWMVRSKAFAEACRKQMTQTTYDVIHFSEVGMAEMITLAARVTPSARVLDLIDAVSMNVRSSLFYQFDLSWLIRLIEAPQLKHFERFIINKVHCASVISQKDSAYLGNPPQINVIPNGIDCPGSDGINQTDIDLLFVGNMSARPNIDAMLWFVRKVWPFIISTRPGTNLYIVGRNPTPAIQNLAGQDIIVEENVKEVSPYLSRARIFIAPMRIGAGQKNKILEAFTHALPVIATRQANDGIYAPDGEAIITRDSPEQMAKAILELLNNPSQRQTIGENALQFVKRNYTWNHSISLLENMYDEALKKCNLMDV